MLNRFKLCLNDYCREGIALASRVFVEDNKEDTMTENEQIQAGSERQMSPERLSDLGHQLDAYPVKDEAQKQRLIQHLREGESQQANPDPGDAENEASTFDG